MLGLCHFIFATFPHEKFFTVTANVTVTVVPLEFWILTEIGKNIFFKIFQKICSSFFKTYIKAYILWVIFMIFKIFFLLFFHFLRIFEKKYPIFLKSMTKILPFPQANWSKKWQFLQFSIMTDHMSHYGKLQKVSFFAPVGLWKRCYLNFPKTYVLDSNGFH